MCAVGSNYLSILRSGTRCTKTLSTFPFRFCKFGARGCRAPRSEKCWRSKCPIAAGEGIRLDSRLTREIGWMRRLLKSPLYTWHSRTSLFTACGYQRQLPQRPCSPPCPSRRRKQGSPLPPWPPPQHSPHALPPPALWLGWWRRVTLPATASPLSPPWLVLAVLATIPLHEARLGCWQRQPPPRGWGKKKESADRPRHRPRRHRRHRFQQDPRPTRHPRRRRIRKEQQNPSTTKSRRRLLGRRPRLPSTRT